MRYLRIATVILFVCSLLLAVWTDNYYSKNTNTDNPTISSSVELLEISVQDPPEAMLQGLSAQDATDGDLTAQIMVASVSHFLEQGTVRVKYVVFDSHTFTFSPIISLSNLTSFPRSSVNLFATGASVSFSFVFPR